MDCACDMQKNYQHSKHRQMIESKTQSSQMLSITIHKFASHSTLTMRVHFTIHIFTTVILTMQTSKDKHHT